MPRYIYKIAPRRERFVETITEAEQAIIGRHWQYLQEQFALGKVQLVGRCVDAAFGITIFEADSLDEARELMEHDPVVAENLFVADLHEFSVLLVRPS